MIGELPMAVGNVQPWPQDYPFVFTPSRQYTVADVGQYLSDLASQNSRRRIGPALWPGVQKLASKMHMPSVQTHVIYSSDTDTISQVTYTTDDFSTEPEQTTYVPGDGDISAASTEAVVAAWNDQGQPAKVQLHKCNQSVSHKDHISCDFTLELVEKLLAERSHCK